MDGNVCRILVVIALHFSHPREEESSGKGRARVIETGVGDGDGVVEDRCRPSVDCKFV
jgi:hypothetical protein